MVRRLLLLVLVILFAGAALPAAREELEGAGDVIRGSIVEAVDGDTVKVLDAEGRRVTVRLIGIDTPETKRPGVGVECGGPQASALMAQLARPGREVTLRTDPTQDTVDRYDRLLAYAAVEGRSLQARMLAAGWATTYVYDDEPFQRYERFRTAERRARDAGLGVHGMCGGDFHSLR